jgi:hypothetical protein
MDQTVARYVVVTRRRRTGAGAVADPCAAAAGDRLDLLAPWPNAERIGVDRVAAHVDAEDPVGALSAGARP